MCCTRSNNGTRGVVSIDYYCVYSTSFCALTNTYKTRKHATDTVTCMTGDSKTHYSIVQNINCNVVCFILSNI